MISYVMFVFADTVQIHTNSSLMCNKIFQRETYCQVYTFSEHLLAFHEILFEKSYILCHLLGNIHIEMYTWIDLVFNKQASDVFEFENCLHPLLLCLTKYFKVKFIKERCLFWYMAPEAGMSKKMIPIYTKLLMRISECKQATIEEAKLGAASLYNNQFSQALIQSLWTVLIHPNYPIAS